MKNMIKKKNLEFLTLDNFKSFLPEDYQKNECADTTQDYNSLRNAILAQRVFGGEIFFYSHDYTHKKTYANLIGNQVYEFGKEPEDVGDRSRMQLVDKPEELASKILPDYKDLEEDFMETYLELLVNYRDNLLD